MSNSERRHAKNARARFAAEIDGWCGRHESKEGIIRFKTPLLDRIAVTVKEAAILIGTNDKQIRKALYARELPAARLGKAYSIGVADLRKWFDSKKRAL